MSKGTLDLGNGVVIKLTDDQIADIQRQTSGIKRYEDINSINDAEEVLKNQSFHTKYVESQFVRKIDWLRYQQETIIKACNFIDNDHKEYIADFTARNTAKYIVWMERKGSGWVFFSVGICYDSSYCSLGLYFKTRKCAEFIGKKHETLFSQCMG